MAICNYLYYANIEFVHFFSNGFQLAKLLRNGLKYCVQLKKKAERKKKTHLQRCQETDKVSEISAPNKSANNRDLLNLRLSQGFK